MIDKLTVYYGLAMRRNCESIEKMRDTICATFYHYSSTDQNPKHDKYPAGKDSWCEWQRAAAKDELQSFEHTYDLLTSDVLQAIRPIYENLSRDVLLERCVGGFNQNNTESYNQLIWKITPKTIASGSVIANIAANISTCVFTEGSSVHLARLYSMGAKLGRSMPTITVERTKSELLPSSVERDLLRGRQECFADSNKLIYWILLKQPGICFMGLETMIPSKLEKKCYQDDPVSSYHVHQKNNFFFRSHSKIFTTAIIIFL